MKNKIIKKSRIGLKKIRGFITAHVLIATSIAVILLMGMVMFVTSNQKRSFDEAARQQSIQAAESGIYYYSWYLAHNLNGRTAQQIKEFWQNENPLGVAAPYEQEVTDFEGVPYGMYRVEVEPPDPASTIVIVKSTGWTYKHPNIKRSIQVRFRRPSWSEFSVLGNDVMRFGDGTIVYGPLHSNNGIRFDGIAHNEVTSGVTTYLDPDTDTVKPGVWTSKSDESEVFLAGKEYPVTSIDFNGVTSNFAYMRTEAQSDGIYLGEEFYSKNVCSWRFGPGSCGCLCWCQVCSSEQIPVEGYHLTLRTDDKIEIRRVFDYQGDTFSERNHKSYEIEEESEAEVVDIPENGLVFVENHVWVDGQIDTARLTIASAKLDSAEDTNIYINDDITYTNKDGRDVIGLIAENDITIGLYSQNDLEIDAAMLAQQGRVGRDAYNSGNSTQYYKRDKITIFGSIATNERYGFAYVDSHNNNVSGYELRNIYFDNNLIYYPPPFFPTGAVYELDLWEEL